MNKSYLEINFHDPNTSDSSIDLNSNKPLPSIYSVNYNKINNVTLNLTNLETVLLTNF